MQYAKAYCKKGDDDWLYTIYVTDALKAIATNTSVLTTEGRVMAKRYYELINPAEETDEEPKSAQEIAEGVVSRFKRD